MRLCAISDRRLFVQDPAGKDPFHHLKRLARSWAQAGVEFIQLREKDLSAHALCDLAEQILAGAGGSRSKLMLNLSPDPVAVSEVAAIVDGIHIPGSPILGSVSIVREGFRAFGRNAVVSLACHSLQEIEIARLERPDFVLFAPVFEKVSGVSQKALPGSGLQLLHEACRMAEDLPVFALGGVTGENAQACLDAGAAGVAAIRLFWGNDWKRLLAAGGPPARNHA